MRAEDAGGPDPSPARRALAVRRSPYAEAVLADRPASYWRLGEATGSEVAEDDAGAHEARVGQRYYTPALGLPGALAGDPSTAARLQEHANLPVGDHCGFEGRAAFTAEAWVRPGVQDNRRRRILAKEAGLSGWYLALGAPSAAAGRLFLTRRHDGHGGNVEGQTAVPTTRWSHVAATYDGSVMRLYLNGTLEGSAPSTIAMADNAAPLTLGENPTGYDSFKGLLDEVAVYPALSAECALPPGLG